MEPLLPQVRDPPVVRLVLPLHINRQQLAEQPGKYPLSGSSLALLPERAVQ